MRTLPTVAAERAERRGGRAAQPGNASSETISDSRTPREETLPWTNRSMRGEHADLDLRVARTGPDLPLTVRADRGEVGVGAD